MTDDINIVFTGSSTIELGKQEVHLSRRALMYDLPGLSFREYLAFSNIMTSPTFFFNQTNAVSTVTAPEHGDFFVGNRFIFEVGGKGKTQRQLQGRPDSFLALDDIEVGMGNQVPLWLFGFLY